ncbi:hypothetical protein [Sulfitobacter sp.]|uniref:hypothetical protein n=1 Tax=Sulfitobacter sp. TaxID=1903071 RepID=UPI00304027E1
MRALIAAVCICSITSCGVTISAPSKPSAKLPMPQFVAQTFWYSNDNAVPQARMLRAAGRHCGKSPYDIQHVGPFGLAGGWFLNFSCASTAE